MYTSILLLALAGTLSKVSPPAKIDWQSEYKAAQALVAKSGKPMAVFIGSGTEGWNKVVRDGQLTPATLQQLKTEFVALYIDTDTATGRAWANAFEIAGRGLVISDRKGQAQAFSHAGDLTHEELNKTLKKYAESDKSVVATEDLGRPGDGYIRMVSSSVPANVQYQNFTPQSYRPTVIRSGGG